MTIRLKAIPEQQERAHRRDEGRCRTRLDRYQSHKTGHELASDIQFAFARDFLSHVDNSSERWVSRYTFPPASPRLCCKEIEGLLFVFANR